MSAERFPISIGESCNCAQCQAERAGRVVLIKSEIFCATCGHGYIDVAGSESYCSRCGSHAFQAIKPAVRRKAEPTHARDCARLSASGQFIFPDTKCTCGAGADR